MSVSFSVCLCVYLPVCRRAPPRHSERAFPHLGVILLSPFPLYLRSLPVSPSSPSVLSPTHACTKTNCTTCSDAAFLRLIACSYGPLCACRPPHGTVCHICHTRCHSPLPGHAAPRREEKVAGSVSAHTQTLYTHCQACSMRASGGTGLSSPRYMLLCFRWDHRFRERHTHSS